MYITNLDATIIVVETLFVVAVGMITARRAERTAEGYFLASGKMPWWLIGAAFVSTSVSSEQIVGTVGADLQRRPCRRELGVVELAHVYSDASLLHPALSANRIMTVPELLNRRYGPACGAIYSYVILLGYVLIFLPPVLYGGGLTFSQLTGWPSWAVILGIALLTASYTLLGGLGSVMWTDAIQCILLIGGGVLLFFVALARIPGGWEAMAAAAPARFHLYRPPTDPEAPFLGLVIATFGVFLFYQSTNQVMIQRVLSARSTRDGVLGIIFAGFINLARPMVTSLLGLIVYHWLDILHHGPTLLPDQQDQAFPYALAEFAPTGIRGVILAGFLAAIMSAMSSLVNAIATIFSLDIYKRFIRTNAGDAELITTGRIAAGCALVVAAIMAPWIANIGLFRYFQTGITYMATPFISVVLLGIFWRRTSYAGAIAGLIGGLIIQVSLALGLWARGISLHWLYVGGLAELLTIMVIVGFSLCTSPPLPEQVEPFLWRPGLVSRFMGDESSCPWWKQVKVWFIGFSVAWCYVYWRFW